ncbi:hypothetical protein EVAR_94510_1 [Eumeta japonica]|uniref:Uncharacterized protein n=1 Tax=Eumeta variegata TaxID=151549 RepID=A0A4C1UW35_EUMVA|nr:hypothetical protein EVAR_94510_1 [Eumeta japonica]
MATHGLRLRSLLLLATRSVRRKNVNHQDYHDGISNNEKIEYYSGVFPIVYAKKWISMYNNATSLHKVDGSRWRDITKSPTIRYAQRWIRSISKNCYRSASSEARPRTPGFHLNSLATSESGRTRRRPTTESASYKIYDGRSDSMTDAGVSDGKSFRSARVLRRSFGV